MEIYKDKHSLGGELHYIVYEADLIIIEEQNNNIQQFTPYKVKKMSKLVYKSTKGQ